MSTVTAESKLSGWRTPAVLIACGCVIAASAGIDPPIVEKPVIRRAGAAV